MPLDELPEALTRPEAYPFPVRRVELRETHISWVFLAGTRVYKVKKPVRFSFLDYSTIERRRHFCAEEVRLNARLAPGVYRGVVALERTASGRLRIDGAGTTVDYAVEMERLPDDRMMDRLLAAGEISNEPIDRLVDLLLCFHAQAATGPDVDRYAAPEAVRRVVLGNLAECPAELAPQLVATLTRRLAALLDASSELLAERARQGRAREGHGDLHAGNVCFLPDRVVAYDCIEFEPAFRCGDVAADLAFLVMDLDARGFRAFGSYLAHRYAHASGDTTLRHVLPLFKVHRALVRAKVAALRMTSASGDEHNAARAESERYLGLAAGYLVVPPVLLVLCGLPGTGKSTIAHAVERALGAVVLSSDLLRKRLFGLEPTERWRGGVGAGPYTSEWTTRTYDALCSQAAAHLDGGRSVIVDATFPVASWRARFLTLASERHVPARVLHVVAPDAVVEERLAARAHDASAVSDADLAVFRHAADRFEAPDAREPALVVVLDAREPPERSALRVVESLLDGAG